MKKVRWLRCRDGWELRCGKRVVANVYDNGTWHTWDQNGTGGENSQERSILMAKVEAEASVIRQKFI